MTEVSRYPIAGATGYLRGELGRGRGLGLLMQGIDLDAGLVTAFLPPSSSANDLGVSYETGALVRDKDRRAAVDALSSCLVREFGVTQSPDRYLLAQFADSATVRPEVRTRTRRGYSVAWLVGSPRTWEDGELWFVGPNHHRSDLTALLTDNLWFPALAVVVTAATPLQDDDVIPASALMHGVSDASAALVGAWGATNYLLWTPDRS